MTHDAGKTCPLTEFSLLEALLQTPSEAIVASNADGRIVFWNPGATRIFGFDAAEAVGQSLDLIIPEKLRARHWQGYRHVMETGQFTIVMLRDEHGTPIGMASIMRDSTARFEEMKSLRRRIAELESAAGHRTF
jgi:PAS domain-containing protein